MWNSILTHFGFSGFVILRLIGALILTLAIELPIAWLMGFRARSELKAVALVNAVTNPPLVFTLIVISALSIDVDAVMFYPAFLVLEIAAVLVERNLLHWSTGRPLKSTFRVSLVANIASFVVGFFFWALCWIILDFIINAAWAPDPNVRLFFEIASNNGYNHWQIVAFKELAIDMRITNPIKEILAVL